jgi:surfactin synthase thioesterase subunit
LKWVAARYLAQWAEDVSGRSVEGSHFFPEHNPRVTIAELRAFLSA